MNPIALTLVKCQIEALAVPVGRGRPPKMTVDYILDRIGYVLRTGCQWAMLPEKDGSWKTVYHYFSKWSKAHIFERAHQDLVYFYSKRGLSREVIVDTSFVKNVWGRDCLGKSPVDRGRKATKVSVMTDARGTPLHLLFHPGNKNDSRSLPHLLHKTSKHLDLKGRHIYADRIYDSAYCEGTIRGYGLINRVSKKRQQPSKSDNQIRIVVEHVFSWLDKFRRIILRYDGLVCHFRSFHCLAACHIIGLRL